MKTLKLALLALLTVAGTAYAKDDTWTITIEKDPVANAFPECSDRSVPCIINDSSGGYIDDFQAAAQAVKRENRPVTISGGGTSACALFADLARPQVCITVQAHFHFHMGTEYAFALNLNIFWRPAFMSWGWKKMLSEGLIVETGKLIPDHSSDVLRRVNANGKFPMTDVEAEMTQMSAYEASIFWPWCVVHPRPRPEWPPNPHPRPPR